MDAPKELKEEVSRSRNNCIEEEFPLWKNPGLPNEGERRG